MPVAGVTSELLVRYLDAWIPTALHSSRRVTFVQSWPETADVDAAEAVLRVFAEFADQLRGRRVSLVFVAPDLGDVDARLDAVRTELNAPVELGVYAVAGAARTHLGAVLTAAQAAGAPVFAYADADADIDAVAEAIAIGKPAELLLLTAIGTHQRYGETVRALGFDLVSSVELVTAADARLLMFATRSVKSLEAFKNELWQLDEYAGVSIRDPHDRDGQLLDISLSPQPGALRRQILTYLSGGERTVTEIRRFALTETVYRVADVTHVLNTLVAAGGLVRRPPHGRIAGDTVIGLPPR
jgi:hypothetical protein